MFLPIFTKILNRDEHLRSASVKGFSYERNIANVLNITINQKKKTEITQVVFIMALSIFYV